MIRSMTGFARLRRELPEGDVTVSLRAVNHRGRDLHFHLPPELDPYEPAVRRAIGELVVRGHVDVRITITYATGEMATAVNRPMLDAWIAAFRQAARDLGVSSEPDLNVALRIPGMMGDSVEQAFDDGFEERLCAVVREAVSELNNARAAEGSHTAKAVEQHRALIAAAATEMDRIRAGIIPHLREKLEQRLGEMLASVVDPARLAQEAALLADRSDVTEEITRLGIHAAQLGKLLEAGGEAGKKIEFLAQEMHREANTVLAKSNAAGEPGRRLSELALAVKSEVEKIREQSLNIE